MVTDLEQTVVQKAGTTYQTVRFRYSIDAIDDKTQQSGLVHFLTRDITSRPLIRIRPLKRTPKGAVLDALCAASTAAIKNFEGVHPTRVQVVPQTPSSIREAEALSAFAELYACKLAPPAPVPDTSTRIVRIFASNSIRTPIDSTVSAFRAWLVCDLRCGSPHYPADLVDGEWTTAAKFCQIG
ncbi:hypothetical protein [Paraburkholderia sp. GAS334]|uniref:hypothetical protein n=1 Tax=Paraburkholderia sp. GAS334 TaxID=3035131 RepID=UPI003D1DE739